MNEDYTFEVIELNTLGDHTVVRRFKTKIEALQFIGMLELSDNDGCTYYVNNLEDEWQEVALMILEESEEEEKQKEEERKDNLWYQFMKNNKNFILDID